MNIESKKSSVIAGLVLLIVASVSVVAFGGNSPSVMGHSPEEVRFDFVKVESDCTSSASFSCSATCPDNSSPVKYVPVGGACISAAATRVNWTGTLFGQNIWGCRDNSHVSGKLYRAIVFCLKSGDE